MYNFGNCAVEKNNKIIKCEENKRKFIVNNKQEKIVLKVYVDNPKEKNNNCTGLKIKGRRCDYLIIEKQDNIANFIELKGHHLSDAIEQLSNSIKVISNPVKGFINEKFNKINAFIITSKVPKHINIIQTKNIFKKKFNSKLDIKNKKIEIKI